MESDQQKTGELAAVSPTPLLAPTADQLRELKTEMKTLTAKERRVLRLRFGLQYGYCHTLQSVAEKMGVTRERIRQIEAKALRKLRHPTRKAQMPSIFGTNVQDHAQRPAPLTPK